MYKLKYRTVIEWKNELYKKQQDNSGDHLIIKCNREGIINIHNYEKYP